MNLPAVPSTLKAVSPYLQRCNELASQHPIIAYWCGYYAAQVGISLKLKDAASRTFLLDLLGALETMKQDIGPNDAIDDEAVSAAYIENFAIKVFASADAEDRRGEATRSTAKKFLASANFLELLRIFDKESTGVESPNDEKIRYAKWKAADIARAFREGRKPTPGPARTADEPANTDAAVAPDPPAITRATSPPPALNLIPDSPDERDFRLTPGAGRSGSSAGADRLAAGDSPSPGSWSTAATPGTPGNRAGRGGAKSAWVSEEMEGRDDSETFFSGEATPPPVVPPPPEEWEGDERSATPPANQNAVRVSPTNASAPHPLTPPLNSDTGLPTGFVPSVIHPDPSAPPLPSPPLGFVPSPVRPPAHLPPATRPARPPPPQSVAIATTTVEEPTLTPQMLALAQKHARFAISALDYEDVEQARKDLRTALRVLGG